MVVFEPDDLIDEEETTHWTEDHPLPTQHAVRCECGRFAKWGGDRHYYNGFFDCYSFDVICSRCGTVTVECV